ncbi:MAG: hypothetical protein U0414_32350 [Polyangiaceae bacterium]
MRADIRVIQEILGHAMLTTTQIYTRVAINRLKVVHDARHPRGEARAARTERRSEASRRGGR